MGVTLNVCVHQNLNGESVYNTTNSVHVYTHTKLCDTDNLISVRKNAPTHTHKQTNSCCTMCLVQSFSEMFVKFLEVESTPAAPAPKLPVYDIKPLSVPPPGRSTTGATATGTRAVHHGNGPRIEI